MLKFVTFRRIIHLQISLYFLMSLIGFCFEKYFLFTKVVYSFQNGMDKINREIMEKVEDVFRYVSTTEDAVDVLRVTYPFSKSQHLEHFFAQKHDQVDKFVICAFLYSLNLYLFNFCKLSRRGQNKIFLGDEKQKKFSEIRKFL